MKKQLLKSLLVCLFAFTGSTAFAYDCEVDGIYYNLNKTDQTASVTNKSAFARTYSGAVHIPGEMAYDGITYNVTSIGYMAFVNCRGLTELTIPNSVTSIGDHAFYGCSGLTELTIPNSVTSIGNNAFQSCIGLTELTIPNSVTSIGDYAFYECSGLTELIISDGENVLSVSGAFAYCPIEILYLGRTVSGALGVLGSLKTLTIGSSVISIGNDAFASGSLEKIVVDTGNPCYDSREDCNAIIHTDGDKVTLVAGCNNTRIPSSVTSIGDWAFAGCSGLTELTIPNSVTSIGHAAFSSCSGLTELTIPNGVTAIGDAAFYFCSGLTELTIPNSVTSIGDWAFDGCSALVSVISLNTTPPTASYYTFDYNTHYRYATLHVPAGCKEAYAQAKCWKDFLNILEDAVDGIAPVVAGQQTTDAIYTIDGVKLNTTSLQDLPGGIYIVNGKKYVVKKP